MARTKQLNHSALESSQDHPGLLWTKVDVCGQTYEVRIVKNEDTKEIEGCEGLTIHNKNLILIKDGLASDRQDDTFIHELFVHALLDASGASHALREHLKISEEQWDIFEELFARMFSPALLHMLKNANMLTLPAKPVLVENNLVKLRAAKLSKSKGKKINK